MHTLNLQVNHCKTPGRAAFSVLARTKPGKSNAIHPHGAPPIPRA